MAPRYDPSDGVAQLTELMHDGGVDYRQTVDPIERRRRRRRGWITTASVVMVVLILLGGYVGYALNAPVAAPTVTTELPDVQVPAAAVLALPPDGASAISVAGGEQYFGADAAGIWAAAGGDDPRAIASISKLITALVVLDAKPLAASEEGPTLTFDKADHALYDKYYVLNATIAAMPTGSRMSQHDALEMMLVVSACNYAEAVADWAFGSQGAFLSATKRWLAANGLTHTTLVEPTGIDARNTSTPSDLIALGKLAMANPAIAQIVALSSLDVPGFEGAPSTNTLLGTDGVRGLKTGTLDPEGANLLYSASLEVGIGHPLDVTGVVLGGFSRETVNRDVTALLGSIAAGFHEVPVGTKGDVVGTYSTPWGASARMVLASNASVFTWSDTPITATMTTTDVTTGRQGETVGSITWTSGDATETVELVLDGDIAPPDEWWRITHGFDLGG